MNLRSKFKLRKVGFMVEGLFLTIMLLDLAVLSEIVSGVFDIFMF